MHASFPPIDMNSEFQTDPKRTQKFSQTLTVPTGQFLHFDYSKNLINDEIITALLNRASQCNLSQKIEQMFQGFPINWTENRPALHVALRDLSNLRPEVSNELEKMHILSEQIRTQKWNSQSGTVVPITTVINIGIGGSDLGPAAIYHALKNLNHDDCPSQGKIKIHWVSNVDDCQIASILRECNPQNTLFVHSPLKKPCIMPN